MEEATPYLQSLTFADGSLVVASKRKAGFLAFLTAISTFSGLYQTYVKEGPMKFILTYKTTQDPIELLFSVFRGGRLGRNNNPCCYEVNSIMRRLLLKNEIKG